MEQAAQAEALEELLAFTEAKRFRGKEAVETEVEERARAGDEVVHIEDEEEYDGSAEEGEEGGEQGAEAEGPARDQGPVAAKGEGEEGEEAVPPRDEPGPCTQPPTLAEEDEGVAADEGEEAAGEGEEAAGEGEEGVVEEAAD